MVSIATVVATLVTVTVLASIAIVGRLHRRGRSWGDVARARLVMGVPWGTLVVVAFVFCVYLFVQDGITDFQDPVTIPFRAWSYFYPLGMVTAGLSHAGPNHLLGNLVGAIVAAPIAEYAWGHYPDGRGGQSCASWRTNPWVRAFLVFPAIVVAVAIGTGFFMLGPVIGFSGVVFAFVGFAIVHYPIVTLVATLGVQGVVATILRALQTPIAVYVAQPRPPAPPSWATIAIQGHALGFLVGLVLGILVLRLRSHRPDALRIWLAVLLYGFSSSLWAIYWFGGANTFILFRGPGVIVVTALAVIVTVAIAGPEKSLVPARFVRAFGRITGTVASTPVDRVLRNGSMSSPGSRYTDRPDRLRSIVSGPQTEEPAGSTVTVRGSATLVVLVVFAVIVGIAVPVNLLVVDESTVAAEAPVEIEDYAVTYAENVPNEQVSGFEVGPFQLDEELESSGLIVVSEERQIWMEAVSAQQLAFSGEETIHVGGPGWREAVTVERTGWTPVGNETVYQVWIWADGGEHHVAHESDGSKADVTIDDRNVSIVPEDGEYLIAVETADTTDTVQVPAGNETTTAAGLTFAVDDGTIYASSNGTEVAIAHEETYN